MIGFTGGKLLIDKLNQILNSEDESSVSYVISLFIKKKSEKRFQNYLSITLPAHVIHLKVKFLST